ncbi:16S rRNA (adenine(1518)-N(6)/adenine(1519)-N(6))-dimethyltransferase RsmA [Dechloromonas sp.]|uniref:16S rRNA (adenine(1518)-N(6)/adenine(1519)-N(6))- dimethyltransferase RsmA n=1 Tax=Dechloromonas sp. TaxID=1917218 RepID=UPI0012055D96|nr:16S rRNA (adenine(1518)-N(6)/adenine(1519)-N(6))-dimethyltransferase RsmA [Dechloromonas sp.]MBU3697248.1 16S rRNA (adenine(1518)-N(6)/adenine(1519)-N(6))-dimethyltransferase RsmA [Dechloromonas sp.]TEX44171.1 MAG: 16S rRNA (adenine(1518)-N(6)/adenine(1519)-N(6))-dimethyltransferase [Rhodocyclaceae bacterium]
MKKPVAGTTHVARKRFGQNFLVDRGIVDAIVSAVRPQAGDQLVEIGPGLGALTEPLLAQVDHLHVVEIDRDLIARLKKKHPPERLSVHEGDALAFDFATIGERLKIVGNLPYNISTPLLFHLADYANCVVDMHFMLQKEVVERMVAEPGDADFGRLSVMLQYRFWMEWLIDVPPESFDPPPKVESAVVRLIPKPASELKARNPDKLASVVLAAFAQRRKMLRNTLKGTLDDAGFVALGINPTLRPEDLPLEDYVRIANYLTP